MDVINPALRSADMQSTTVEVNLIPPEAADFRSAQSVPVRNQDHGSVAMAIAGSLAGSLLEPLDLPFGQVFPGPELGYRGVCGELSGLRWLRRPACGRILPCESTSAWFCLSVKRVIIQTVIKPSFVL